MAQTTWQGYLKLLVSLTGTLEELTRIEQEKTGAVSRGDLPGVEACMKREQALSMTLRGYDQKRETMLRDLGLAGVPLSQLREHSPAQFDLETKQVAEELKRQYTLFQAASEVARDTLECNLRVIEKMQARQAGDSAQAEENRKTHQTDFRA